jgi:LacI family transcriptional regulator
MTIIEFLRVDPEQAIPLSTQISQQLAWLIASGEIREGDKLPSLRNLAQHLGVNLHTVRAAYGQLESAGVVITRQGGGTTVVPHDRQCLAACYPDLPSFTIGVLIPDYSLFYGPLLEGIEGRVEDDPLLTFVCNTRDDSQRATRCLDQLTAKRVDGVIVVSIELPSDSAFAAGSAGTTGIPPVVFADWQDGPEPLVLFDSEDGGFQATDHLLGHGHRRVGLLTPPTEWSNVGPIFAGYERALSSAGLAVERDLIELVPGFGIDDGYAGCLRLLDRSDPPKALFAVADMLAVGAMQAIGERGLRIPDDVALVGFGDIQLAELLDPPLTTVSLPAFEMGTAAMSLLQQLIAGEPAEPRRITLNTRLILRSSCGCA